MRNAVSIDHRLEQDFGLPDVASRVETVFVYRTRAE